MNEPTVHSVKRTNGVAGQVSYTAVVQYTDEPKEAVTFVGSAYGGPVVMVTPAGMQHFVTDPGRFGEFDKQWVERFFE